MAFEYVNRKQDRYYLQAAKTRTGKTRYYFGRKMTGTPVDQVPEGKEAYESPETGQVLLRKSKPTRITAEEREAVADGIRRYAKLESFLLDVYGDSLTVYLSTMDEHATSRLLESIRGLGFMQHTSQFMKQAIVQTSTFSKAVRFQLVDEKKRLFSIERWCFRGSIDDWIDLEYAKPLSKLVQKYFPTLGTDEFYEWV